MKLPLFLFALGAISSIPAAASAENSADMAVGFENEQRANSGSESGSELPPYLQCVPFARDLSGIQLYGDAHSWWGQAAGRYQRGNQPQVGAVMAFQPHRNMTLGHVAAVSRIIDSRTVLISHSNWSPINGRRGQIERDVRAEDVSPANDWSMVRVWYHPLQAIGSTPWPVHGFIYAGKFNGDPKPALAEARLATIAHQPERQEAPSNQFSQAFADLGVPGNPAAMPPQQLTRTSHKQDPVRDAIARYE